MAVMHYSAGDDPLPDWQYRLGRVIGACLVGAALGATVAGIWHAGWAAAGNACRNTGGDTFCIPLAQTAGAAFASGLVICAGVFLGFVILGIRPKRLTIPVGSIVTALLVWAVGFGIPGGPPPPAWTTAVAAGAGLAALALMMDSGKAQIAGMIALPVVLAGAFLIPRVIHCRIQEDTRQRQLAALGFPLLVPAAAGYYASGAYAVGGGLSVSMSSDTPGRSVLSREPAISVDITPATSPETEPGPAGKPAKCAHLPPDPGCRELKPGLWLLPDGGAGNGGEVITWRGGLEVDAWSLGYSPVSTSALVQAATDLRPASAASLAGLG